ncbi:MAG: ribosomal protein S18-alanine N-acetyltransferase [Aridibacter sp.]
MAVMQKIKEFFIPAEFEEKPEIIIPAPPTIYSIHPLTKKNLREILLLNLRCFKRGEDYNKATFTYLLTDSDTLGYQLITASKQIVGFVFIVANNKKVGHITTIGIAPEHRKRGLARKLLNHAENVLLQKGFDSVVLEVRVSNFAAQNLYSKYGYVIIQKLDKYYNNDEDAYLMSKFLK